MSRDTSWTTTAVDFEKLRTQAQEQEVGGEDSFLTAEMYVIEQGQHRELKSLYDKISGEAELTGEDRLVEFRKLLKTLVILDPSLDQEITSLPITEGLQQQLQTIASKEKNDEILPDVRFNERYQQIAALSATAALGLSSGESNASIKIAIDGSIRNFQEKNANPQIVLDLPRTPISFYKDGQTYKFPAKARATTEVIRTDLSEFSRTNGLNLTGEQIDYIMMSTDQEGSVGAAFIWAQIRNRPSQLDDIKYTESQIAPTAGESRCHIDIEGSQVKLTVLRGHRGHAVDDNSHVIEGEPGPVTFKTIQADITELKEDRLLPGLASSPVTPILLHTSSHTQSPYIVPDAISDETAASSYGIKEICDIKIKSELTETVEQQVDLIARRSPSEFTAQMIASMAKIRGADPLTLTLDVALEKGITGAKLEELASSVANAVYEESQEREKTYFLSEAKRRDKQKNLDTIMRYKTEGVGAFNGALIDTYISQRRVGEIIASHPDAKSSRLLEYRRAKSSSDEGNAQLIAGYASQQNLSNEKIGETLAEFVSAELSDPLELVIYFAKHKKSQSEDLGEIISSLSTKLGMLAEESQELLTEFARSQSLTPKESGKLLGSFAKSQSLSPEHSKNLIVSFTKDLSFDQASSKDLITSFVTSQSLTPKESGKLLANYTKHLKLTQDEQLEILASFSNKSALDAEKQGKLLINFCREAFSREAFLNDPTNHKFTNFAKFYCSKKGLTEDSSAELMVSFNSDQTMQDKVYYLRVFTSLKTPESQIEFLAKFIKASHFNTEKSAEMLCEYSEKTGTAVSRLVQAVGIEERPPLQKTTCLLTTAFATKAKASGSMLDLDTAISELNHFTAGLDQKRARRYIIKVADKAGVKTDVGRMEKAGNWFRDIGDRIMGRKTPEEILFKGDAVRMSELYKAPDISAHSNGAASGSTLDGEVTPTLSRATALSSIRSDRSSPVERTVDDSAIKRESPPKEPRRSLEQGDKPRDTAPISAPESGRSRSRSR